MANQITDNRTAISANNNNTNIIDGTGAAAGNTNTETFVEGSGSVSEKSSNSTIVLLYDFSTGQNFANNTFYLWWNCSTAGKLVTRSAGGIRIRFSGATVSDFFEIYVAGSDTYTGGFEMSVIDIERAYTAAVTNGDANTGTGGTPPATNAIRAVGVVFQTNSMVSGNVDNVFIDAFWRLPQNTPGIIVEGRNGGTTDWTFEDIFDAGDPGDTTKAWGTGFRESNGSLTFNTPIQIGINDTTVHQFSDTNVNVGWQDQFVDLTSFYSITLLGGASGQTVFTLGTVSGTGNDRVGTLGGSIFAPATGPRWSLDANDTNVNECNLYGLTMTHGETFDLDSGAVNVVNSTFLDCTLANVSNSDILGCLVVNANTADGAAFMVTDDLGDIVNTSFVFSDGHAIECTGNAVDPQSLTGCTFTGYGADSSTDAAMYYTYTGTLTVNVTDGSLPTFRDAAGATTTQSSSVPVKVTCQTSDGTAIQNVQVSIYLSSDNTEVTNTDTDVNGEVNATFSGTTPAAVYWRARKSSPGDTKYVKQSGLGTIGTNGFDITVTLVEDTINNA